MPRRTSSASISMISLVGVALLFLVPHGVIAQPFSFGDIDRDGVPNATDNCPFVANENQADVNTNGVGDACEVLPPVLPALEVAPVVPAAEEPPASTLEVAPIVPTLETVPEAPVPLEEPTPAPELTREPSADPDNDGVPNATDNCPFLTNEDQADADDDGVGDACQIAPSALEEAVETALVAEESPEAREATLLAATRCGQAGQVRATSASVLDKVSNFFGVGLSPALLKLAPQFVARIAQRTGLVLKQVCAYTAPLAADARMFIFNSSLNLLDIDHLNGFTPIQLLGKETKSPFVIWGMLFDAGNDEYKGFVGLLDTNPAHTVGRFVIADERRVLINGQSIDEFNLDKIAVIE